VRRVLWEKFCKKITGNYSDVKKIFCAEATRAFSTITKIPEITTQSSTVFLTDGEAEHEFHDRVTLKSILRSSFIFCFAAAENRVSGVPLKTNHKGCANSAKKCRVKAELPHRSKPMWLF
jgi:hypothetical protein